MKNYILYFITALTSLNLHAQNFESIPDSLKVDAVCLILDNSETLEIFSKNKFIHSTKSKSLVLKNEDNSVNNILIYYNQFEKGFSGHCISRWFHYSFGFEVFGLQDHRYTDTLYC